MQITEFMTEIESESRQKASEPTSTANRYERETMVNSQKIEIRRKFIGLVRRWSTFNLPFMKMEPKINKWSKIRK